MGRNVFFYIGVIVVGALLGSFLGQFIGMVFPEGAVHNLFAKEIVAGLSPATLDLRVIELTVGCLLKFNITAVLGILTAAFLFKSVFK
jgi:hypothetical protein